MANTPASRNDLEVDYEILVDLVKHQHDRISNHFTAFIAVATFLATFIGWFISEAKSTEIIEKYGIVVFLCFLGVAICDRWRLVILRIIMDTRLRYFQLRDIERRLGRDYGIFTEGYRFFLSGDGKTVTGDGKSLVFSECEDARVSDVPVSRSLRRIPSVFALLYLAILAGAIIRIGFYLRKL